MKKINWRNLLDSGGVWIALFAFLAVASASNEYFRSPQNLINITRQVSYSGIIALGMTFVIAAGGIDLAVGSLFALAGVVSLFAMNSAGGAVAVQLAAGFGAALGVGVAGGMLNGVLVGAARVQTSNSLYQPLVSAKAAGLPLATLVLFGLTAVLAVVLRLTRFGRHVCAVGSNERVACYSAIRTGVVKFWTYVLVGGLAGLSAFLLGGRLNSISSSGAGLSYELDAIAAVIIGGTAMTGGKATVPGTLAGVLLLGIVSNVLDMWGISVNLQGAVKGLVIIIAVLIQYRRK